MAMTLGMLRIAAPALRALQAKTDQVTTRKVLALGYPDIIAAPSHFTELFGASFTEKLLWRQDSAEIVQHHKAHAITDRIVQAEQFFELLGLRLEVADIAEIRGGERIIDLNEPCPVDMHGQYAMVLDVGTCEHVFNIGQAVKNMAQMVTANGYILSCASLTMFNHCFYNLNPTWYYDFYGTNGFQVQTLKLAQHTHPDQFHDVSAYGRFGTAPENALMIALMQRCKVQDIAWPVQYKYRKYVQPVKTAAAEQKPQKKGVVTLKIGSKLTAEELYPKLINRARGLLTNELSMATLQRQAEMIAGFDALGAANAQATDVLVFHTNLTSGGIDSLGVSFNPDDYHYGEVLSTFVECARRHISGRIILVTDQHTEFDASLLAQVQLVRLNIQAEHLMYERVMAMRAFVHSKAFNAPLLCLDGDAFLNASFDALWDLRFDVAVTVRYQLNNMPVNEGVLLVKPTNASRDFFDAYLATYEVLAGDKMILSYYPDVKCWRGGQLTLNALCAGGAPFDRRDVFSVANTQVRALPCLHFNFSYVRSLGISEERFAQSYVVHMKGSRKQMLQAFRHYAGLLEGA